MFFRLGKWCKRGLSGKRSPAADRNSALPISAGPYKTCSPAVLSCGQRGKTVPQQRYAGRSAPLIGGSARHSTADRPSGPAGYAPPPYCIAWDGHGAAKKISTLVRVRRTSACCLMCSYGTEQLMLSALMW